jgi:hypothetical protein
MLQRPTRRREKPGRSGFTFHHFWVTPYRDGELYAAGAYPTQATEEYKDTLYYYANEELIENRDIVVWYSLGFARVPQPEDYPLMSSMKHWAEHHLYRECVSSRLQSRLLQRARFAPLCAVGIDRIGALRAKHRQPRRNLQCPKDLPEAGNSGRAAD